jgi:hypothetical protein
LTQSIDLKGAQTHFSRIPSSGVTVPPGTTLVSDFSSRQRVGAGASKNHILMRSRSREPQRLIASHVYGYVKIRFRFHFRWKSLGERPS